MTIALTRSYTSNGLNQYTASGSATLSYDSNGNLSSDGSTSYVYDDENHLVSASGGHSATLAYDPLGRLWQTVGSVTGTTDFEYDPGSAPGAGSDRILEEFNGSGTLQRLYVYGAGEAPVAWYEFTGGTTRRYLLPDERGSTVAVADDSGNAVAINRYDEYGIPQSGNGGRFQYAGQALLIDLGLFYAKARIYSPTLGRFLQTDPIGYGDGMNWYGYGKSDPVNRVDPTGLNSPGLDPGLDFSDIYERYWSPQEARGYCDRAWPDGRCDLIDPLAVIDGKLYHMADAFRDKRTDRVLGQLWRDWKCSAPAGSLYPTRREAVAAGGRKSESDRKKSYSNDERYFFTRSVPILGGLMTMWTYTDPQRLIGCNPDEDSLKRPSNTDGFVHSHRPNCGNGLSTDDRDSGDALRAQLGADYLIGLVNESGSIAVWEAGDKLTGDGRIVGNICH